MSSGRTSTRMPGQGRSARGERAHFTGHGVSDRLPAPLLSPVLAGCCSPDWHLASRSSGQSAVQAPQRGDRQRARHGPVQHRLIGWPAEPALQCRPRHGPQGEAGHARGTATEKEGALPGDLSRQHGRAGLAAAAGGGQHRHRVRLHRLRPFNPLFDALPRLLHLPAEGVGAWVTPMLEHAASESGARRAGSAALLQRVSEMVFVDGARRYLDTLPEEAQGWLGALRDRQVGRAISLMHAEPAQPWTLEELGRRIGLSRSALHERYVALTGMPPMQYLTNWRMQCGARLLREGHAGVAAVALEVGYGSEAAFSRAFKRATGLPPAAWRRTQVQSAGTAV